jgi:hypothetical protein
MLPPVIKLWTVAREMGVPASLLRRATLSKERRRATISARSRRANSPGVAAPAGSAGTTADVVATLIDLTLVSDQLGSIFLPPLGPNKYAGAQKFTPG